MVLVPVVVCVKSGKSAKFIVLTGVTSSLMVWWSYSLSVSAGTSKPIEGNALPPPQALNKLKIFMRAYTRIQLRIEITPPITAELYNFLYSLINNFNLNL